MGEKFNLKKRFMRLSEMEPADRRNAIKEFFINNLLYILLIAAIVGI